MNISDIVQSLLESGPEELSDVLDGIADEVLSGIRWSDAASMALSVGEVGQEVLGSDYYDIDEDAVVSVVPVFGLYRDTAEEEIRQMVGERMGQQVTETNLADQMVRALENHINPDEIGCDQAFVIRQGDQIGVVLVKHREQDFGGDVSLIDFDVAEPGRQEYFPVSHEPYGPGLGAGIFDSISGVPEPARSYIERTIDHIASEMVACKRKKKKKRSEEEAISQGVVDLLMIGEDLRLSTGSRRVLRAFLDQQAAEGRKLSTDGARLDGLWMGGRDIAHWNQDGQIEPGENRPHVRSDQTVLDWIRRNAPKNYLAF
jgi:hypothetical protein